MNMIASPECKRHAKLMGSDFEFIVAECEGDKGAIIDEAIDEVKRIEALLTEFSETSQTSSMNRNAGFKSMPVDDEVYELIGRCKKIASLTQGAFDITAVGLRKLYNFKGGHFDFPTTASITEALRKVGSEKIILGKNRHVYLSTAGMHIGFGAIGKGYASDMLKTIFQKRGIKNAVINASGDLTAMGCRTDGSPWRVGIADPSDSSRVMAWIPVQNTSVATSGNYEQFFEKDGIRYAHTIDPKSGLPVSGIKSVTVVSPSAELADALATAVTIMGTDVGLHFLEQLPGVHGLIVDDRNRIFRTRHLQLNLSLAS